MSEKDINEMTEEEKQAAYVALENGVNPNLTPEQLAVKNDIMNRIQHTLNKVRPYLQADGGDVELLDYADGVASVTMHGACGGCMMASVDVTEGMQALVVDEVPEVERVILVNHMYSDMYSGF